MITRDQAIVAFRAMRANARALRDAQEAEDRGTGCLDPAMIGLRLAQHTLRPVFAAQGPLTSMAIWRTLQPLIERYRARKAQCRAADQTDDATLFGGITVGLIWAKAILQDLAEGGTL
jgi:hypothetical protein